MAKRLLWWDIVFACAMHAWFEVCRRIALVAIVAGQRLMDKQLHKGMYLRV